MERIEETLQLFPEGLHCRTIQAKFWQESEKMDKAGGQEGGKDGSKRAPLAAAR